MKKLLLFFIPFLLVIVSIPIILFFISNSSGKGALQVTSIPKSQVYLDGKLIGETPFCKCELPDMLKSGEYTIKLVPKESGYSPFEEKIKITKSVLTAVDRTFGKGATSHGSVITLTPLEDKKTTQLLVLSLPDKADTFLDSSLKGATPLLIKEITESDHELMIRKSGYKEKAVRIRTVSGYKLEALVFLGVSESLTNVSTVPTASPTATPKVVKVTILQTPTTDNHLNVRESPSLSGKIISQVFTGETFDFMSEQNDWLEIKLTDGKTGWVSRQYVEKK